MKLPNIGGLISLGKTFASTYRSELLLGTSLATTVSGMVAAGRAGYKSGQEVLLEELEIDRESVWSKTLSLKEKTALTWMNYLPAAGIGAAALGSTTALHIVHVKDKKQLAAACLMAVDEIRKESKLEEGKLKKALNELGVATEEDELDDVALEDGTARLVYGDGLVDEKYLIRDARTQRDRWGTKLEVDEAVIELNSLLLDEDTSLNTFYTYAGFNDVPDGTDYGWVAKTKVSLKWANEIRDDGRLVRSFTFRPAPKPGHNATH